MKFAVVALFVALVAVVSAAPRPEDEKYTDKYDNVDIKQILGNERLLLNYGKCLLDKGNCTPDGAELKKNLPDALENECSKCSAGQKDKVEEVLAFLHKSESPKIKELNEQVKAKYDPEHKYEERIKKIAEEKGYKL